MPALGATHCPASSGPRWPSASAMRATTCASSSPLVAASGSKMPAIPHKASERLSGGGGPSSAGERLSDSGERLSDSGERLSGSGSMQGDHDSRLRHGVQY